MSFFPKLFSQLPQLHPIISPSKYQNYHQTVIILICLGDSYYKCPRNRLPIVFIHIFTNRLGGKIDLSKIVLNPPIPRGSHNRPYCSQTFANRLFGVMAWTIPVFVALSTFGAVNGILLTSSRLFYAGACEGQMPEILTMIQISRLTPAPAVICMVSNFSSGIISQLLFALTLEKEFHRAR